MDNAMCDLEFTFYELHNHIILQVKVLYREITVLYCEITVFYCEITVMYCEITVFFPEIAVLYRKSCIVKYHPQFWTESHVKFSPKGSYLATCHKQGIALWGGPDFSKVGRFNHHNVTYFQFSPCERLVYEIISFDFTYKISIKNCFQKNDKTPYSA